MLSVLIFYIFMYSWLTKRVGRLCGSLKKTKLSESYPPLVYLHAYKITPFVISAG